MIPNQTVNSQPEESNENKDLIPIFQLWDKYESIAMHFNDLILKIRIQALASVAAISIIVGIFNKTGSETQTFNWVISAGVFFLLMLFWLAIWIIDFKYYNRLLIGSVQAIKGLEKLSETQTHTNKINISEIVEKAVSGELKRDLNVHKKDSSGRWCFYILVFIGLVLGFIISAIAAYTHIFEPIMNITVPK
jgi:hypothetical protein